MTCHIGEQDKCQHGVPVESPDMHDCPHDGFRCSPCGHPACHTVTPKVVRVPHLGTRWRGVCVLCKLAGPLTDDKGEASEWETTHHARVMGR